MNHQEDRVFCCWICPQEEWDSGSGISPAGIVGISLWNNLSGRTGFLLPNESSGRQQDSSGGMSSKEAQDSCSEKVLGKGGILIAEWRRRRNANHQGMKTLTENWSFRSMLRSPDNVLLISLSPDSMCPWTKLILDDDLVTLGVPYPNSPPHPT